MWAKFFVLFLLVLGKVFAGDSFKTLRIDELEKIMSKPSVNVFIYDVNVLSTRKSVGLVPGAILIDEGSTYNVEQTLPKNKKSKLVFYCANAYCTASHTAANRALTAGYKNVSVMVDGIYGWRDAKKTLEPFIKTPQMVKPHQVMEMLKQDSVMVIDVREAEERHEIIDRAEWFPMSNLNESAEWTDFVKKLPKDKTIALHCAVGARSKKIAEKLSQEGFRTAYFKGPDEWKSEGLPLSAGPAK